MKVTGPSHRARRLFLGPAGWLGRLPKHVSERRLCPAQVDRKIISLPTRRRTDLRSGKRGSQRSKALMLNSKEVKMKTLPQVLFWLGLISVPLAWLVWLFGPQIEVTPVLAKITDPALRVALEQA